MDKTEYKTGINKGLFIIEDPRNTDPKNSTGSIGLGEDPSFNKEWNSHGDGNRNMKYNTGIVFLRIKFCIGRWAI